MTLPDFHRVIITPTLSKPFDTSHRDAQPVAENLVRALNLRQKWVYQRECPEWDDKRLDAYTTASRERPFTFDTTERGSVPGAEGYSVTFGDSGIAELAHEGQVVSEWMPPSLAEFNQDLQWLHDIVCNGKSETTFAAKRLRVLEANFKFYHEMNWSYEAEEARDTLADFSSVPKVDTHIHAAASFTRGELLDFMEQKLIGEPNRTVALAKGLNGDTSPRSLQEVFHAAGLEGLPQQIQRQLTADRLHVAARQDMFKRFDNFNDSYNPLADPNLRAIFMKSSNKIEGEYFAGLCKTVFNRLQKSTQTKSGCRNQKAEPRLSIYGRNVQEWDQLGKWFVQHRVLPLDPATGHSTEQVRWVIQIPRLFGIFAGKPGCFNNFAELMANIFQPLFEVTLNPSSHPELYLLLRQVGYIDCVDDESVPDGLTLSHACKEASGALPAAQYSAENPQHRGNPPYSYYLYHLYANLAVLNRLREHLGYNTLPLKPHAGEAGAWHHLCTAFLLADSVNHGIMLTASPPLQYLYYLAQIGLAVCPLSNHVLFCPLTQSPIGSFIRQGLLVSLGTDDPLQFHETSDPLLEEYTVASKYFNLTHTDMCELARSSVLMSGFSSHCKAQWVGESYHHPDPTVANNPDQTNVPHSRLIFRAETYRRELAMLAGRRLGKGDLTWASDSGSVQIGHVEVDMHIAQRIAKKTRELHDLYNDALLNHDQPVMSRMMSCCSTTSRASSQHWHDAVAMALTNSREGNSPLMSPQVAQEGPPMTRQHSPALGSDLARLQSASIQPRTAAERAGVPVQNQETSMPWRSSDFALILWGFSAAVALGVVTGSLDHSRYRELVQK